MRLLRKIAIKLFTMAIMVGLMGALLRYGKPYIMKSAGVPEGMPGVEGIESAHFSSEESDLMGTIFKSAIRLFTGQAKRDELAGELSTKLYGDRAAAMSELGVELEKPGGNSPLPGGLPQAGAGGASAPAPSAEPNAAKVQRTAKLPTKLGALASTSPAKKSTNPARDALVARIVDKAKANPELSLVPIVIFGMLVVHLFRRRRSPADDFVLPDLSALIPSEAEAYEMKHLVHSLPAEDFELLVALIYQRQGYRVTMPAGRGGGDFLVQRKSERLLVQCKKLSPDHKVHVDRVRELHEAAVTAGVTRGVYVASCGISWDARNFAKVKGVTLINARMLDTLLDGARAKPDEDFLEVAEWAPKLMGKVKLTPPLCPACEAPMDEVNVSHGSVWVCSQRPDCRGRRSARNFHETTVVLPKAKVKAEPACAKAPVPEEPPEVLGGRARTISPSMSAAV